MYSMLVVRKEDNTFNTKSNRDEEHAYNLMLYILKNFSDLSIDDQLVVFNKMSFARVLKPKFLTLRAQVLEDYGQTINQDTITITDLKADYHIANGMLEKHLDSIEQIDQHLEYYENLFEKEKSKPHPDIDTLSKISLVVERLINRRSVLNSGTPIILFFRFQSKKQKLQVQQMKEKYQQQLLILKRDYEDKKTALEEKQKDQSTSNTDIKEKDNVTNPNIDELEHYAKLKDSGNRSLRGNTNRSDSKPESENQRVQSDTSNSSTSGITSEDRSSEIFGGTEERRSKEAVF